MKFGTRTRKAGNPIVEKSKQRQFEVRRVRVAWGLLLWQGKSG